MKPLRPAMLVLLAALGAHAGAATVYRCGSAYSQTPCEGGTAVDASDPRTPEQRAEGERAAAAERRRAEEMARERRANAAAAAAEKARAGSAAKARRKGKAKVKSGPVQPLGAEPNPKA